VIGRKRFLKVGLIVLFITVGSVVCGFAEERYTVKSGDTLHDIAKAFGISVEILKAANQLEMDLIKPNQILVIPGTVEREGTRVVDKLPREADPYIVKSGDTLSGLSVRTGVSVEEIKQLNHLQSSRLQIGQKLLLKKQVFSLEDGEEMGDGDQGVEAPTANVGEEPTTSESLEKWASSEERNLFVRVARTFLGVPYRLGGATMRGIDCSAFVKKVYEIFGVALPRTAREQSCVGRPIGKDELEEGDLVFFKTQRARRTHVGIYIGNGEFVHASSWNKEVKVDHLDKPYFHQRFLRGVRVKEMVSES
jgi:cell wall-associated NlpC family hydrolase